MDINAKVFIAELKENILTEVAPGKYDVAGMIYNLIKDDILLNDKQTNMLEVFITRVHEDEQLDSDISRVREETLSIATFINSCSQ